MHPDKETQPDVSPFHDGEQRMQARIDKRETAEQFGQRFIRTFLLDQHRTFFAQLRFLVVGGVDADDWPWASVLTGQPGFLSTPDTTTISVRATAAGTDPLHGTIKSGAKLGLLGIDPSTRRRNRLNGQVTSTDATGFTLAVDQSFGNCPQYIQSRTLDTDHTPAQSGTEIGVQTFREFDDKARAMIGAADTFFVSSYDRTATQSPAEGVDVSHRGGKPGFVRIEANTLTIPDYSGNHYFNTLGNFLVNPKAGLLFADFQSGDLLHLTGTVELLPEDDPQVVAFEGAERAWRFTLDHGCWRQNALPIRYEFEAYAPSTLMTGNWQQQLQATESQIADSDRHAWRPFRVAAVEDESSVIRSFYLEPADGGGLAPFQAGQFLTIRIAPESDEPPYVRTYTVSSAPQDPHYRISVKREEHGQASCYLHEAVGPGYLVEIKAPTGTFFIDPTIKRPAVLIAGGVGITPMISMARHVVNQGMPAGNPRPLTILHATRDTHERAFGKTFHDLEIQTAGKIRYFSFVNRPRAGDKPGIDFTSTGHITKEVLRQILPLDDYDFYLCGPPPFMQAIYDALRMLGVHDARIHAEAFGPASLHRTADAGAQPPPRRSPLMKSRRPKRLSLSSPPPGSSMPGPKPMAPSLNSPRRMASTLISVAAKAAAAVARPS
ncbi:pyridoxamine 5'-phosphate oxidase family protein [Hoeflea sp. G2-23]|uniref:Pyridoxamine 5'-phosphate oxidase family protein n=1 Tax=Hoeflea algicola TaxID=2983763 RepID=A0ABT3Z708_9HYPH|nr:pyridoxamine 5'-phosphate oxidase family protein [Hoeflea algicola]MCY0147560.1 pyridoxamine 5'-phosphate oxidase family protein [Hoeflea algicola]